MSRNDQILTEQIIQQEFSKTNEFNTENIFLSSSAQVLYLKIMT